MSAACGALNPGSLTSLSLSCCAQVAGAVAAGVLIAVAAVIVGASSLHYPIDGSLVLAVATTIGLTSLLASLPVALIAANRDPARVLRVP